MPRRRVAAKREVLDDPKYGSQILAKFMNHVMESGKKAVAERIVYGALEKVKERKNSDPLEIFEKALGDFGVVFACLDAGCTLVAAVVWLCSDAAAFMVGHALVMDGGQTIQ